MLIHNFKLEGTMVTQVDIHNCCKLTKAKLIMKKQNLRKGVIALFAIILISGSTSFPVYGADVSDEEIKLKEKIKLNESIPLLDYGANVLDKEIKLKEEVKFKRIKNTHQDTIDEIIENINIFYKIKKSIKDEITNNSDSIWIYTTKYNKRITHFLEDGIQVNVKKDEIKRNPGNSPHWDRVGEFAIRPVFTKDNFFNQNFRIQINIYLSPYMYSADTLKSVQSGISDSLKEMIKRIEKSNKKRFQDRIMEERSIIKQEEKTKMGIQWIDTFLFKIRDAIVYALSTKIENELFDIIFFNRYVKKWINKKFSNYSLRDIKEAYEKIDPKLRKEIAEPDFVQNPLKIHNQIRMYINHREIPELEDKFYKIIFDISLINFHDLNILHLNSI